MQIVVEKIDKIAFTNAKGEDPTIDAVVHLKLVTKLGDYVVPLPTKNASTLDQSVQAARSYLVEWAQEIIDTARSQIRGDS